MGMVAERQPGKLNSSSLPFLQFPKMTVTENLVKKKLKIKIGSKGVRVESAEESSEYDGFTHGTLLNESAKLNMNFKVKLPVGGHSKKRGTGSLVDAQKEKRRKMEPSISRECGRLLRELMTHEFGEAFNEPVDPVAHNIPDYFSIITEPMDLGTVKLKLENNVYSCADEFAADVRLTFSNCMLYNPPYNEYHLMAKDLRTIFSQRWKLLEAKLKRESKNVGLECISDGYRESGRGILHAWNNISPSDTLSLEEKQNLRSQLKEMLRGRMPENLEGVLRKYRLCSLKGRTDMDTNAIDDGILRDMKRVVKNSFNFTTSKVEPAKMTQSGRCPLLSRVVDKGTDSGSRTSFGSANHKALASTMDMQCGSCGHLTCQCPLQNIKAQSSSSDISSERVLQEGHCGVSGTESDVKNSTTVHMCRSDPDSNGAESVMEDRVCLSSGLFVCGSTTVSDGGWTPSVDVQLSPKKALRAAMLKSRFADTIFKAKQKTLLNQGDKADPVKTQEKLRQEKQQLEEKARIEAQIIAAEAASRRRAEADLKTQRQREREAARIAFEQMEKTVEIEDNRKAIKELEILCRSSPLKGNHLERLGLYLKQDPAESDAEEAVLGGDSEEGEILL